jgi:hypothetical protein
VCFSSRPDLQEGVPSELVLRASVHHFRHRGLPRGCPEADSLPVAWLQVRLHKFASAGSLIVLMCPVLVLF